MPATTSITPYLFFGGRCEEAIAFYTKAVGAETVMLMRFDQSPDPTPEGMLPPGFEKKVMHAHITIRGIPIYLSDGCEPGGKMHGVQLALTVPTEGDAHTFFNALAAGGKVNMPLCKTFWSPCYGMLTDPFGLDWMVMVPGEAPPK